MTKASGEFSIRKISGRQSFVGAVSVDVELDSENEDAVEVSILTDAWDGVDETFSLRSAVIFGVVVAKSYAQKSGIRLGVRVTVKNVRGYYVDTTPVVLSFAACRAVLGALGLSGLKYPMFDEGSGVFVFSR